MNNQFDELTRTLAQSVTRRAALKKFGAGMDNRFGDQKKELALVCVLVAKRACPITHDQRDGRAFLPRPRSL